MSFQWEKKLIAKTLNSGDANVTLKKYYRKFEGMAPLSVLGMVLQYASTLFQARQT